jgi:DNA polymerase III epsilon subunit-like protein
MITLFFIALVLIVLYFYYKNKETKKNAELLVSNRKKAIEATRTKTIEISLDDEFVLNADFNINIGLPPSEIQIPFFMIFDIETTGLIPKYANDVEDLNLWPKVVQLAWIITDYSNKVIDTKTFYIKQKEAIPQSAIDIHGVTNEKCEKDGFDIKFVLKDFFNDINKVKTVVCHNYEFDASIMEIEFKRHGYKWPLKRKFCTMLKGKKYANITFYNSNKLKYPKLEELFGALILNNTNVKILTAHNAAIDTLITAVCLNKFIEYGDIEIQ